MYNYTAQMQAFNAIFFVAMGMSSAGAQVGWPGSNGGPGWQCQQGKPVKLKQAAQEASQINAGLVSSE
jgi:hypothetical protein